MDQPKVLKSTFYNDLKKIAIFEQYLDIRVYPFLEKKYNIKIERVNDLDRQNKGIDLLLLENNKTIYVDEKAQIEYLDTRNIPTCAFEIEYSKGRSKKVGWLFNENKETNEIFYITRIRTYKREGSFSSPDDLFSCFIWRINVEAMRNKLESLGLGKLDLVRYYWKNQKNGRAEIATIERANIQRSIRKAEAPMNLIIRPEILHGFIGDGCKLIWDDSIANKMNAFVIK